MMPGNMPAVIQTFYCYVDADRKLLKELDKHLRPLHFINAIATWSALEIQAGMDLELELQSHVRYSDLFLLLISPDFLATNLCNTGQMTKALEKYKAGEADIIPILLHSSLWKLTPIGHLQASPRNERPIAEWKYRNHVINIVAKEIIEAMKKLIEKFRPRFIERHIDAEEFDARISNPSWVPTDASRAQSRAKAEEKYKFICETLEKVRMEIFQQGLIIQQDIDSLGENEIETDEDESHTDPEKSTNTQSPTDELPTSGDAPPRHIHLTVQYTERFTEALPLEDESVNVGIQ